MCAALSATCACKKLRLVIALCRPVPTQDPDLASAGEGRAEEGEGAARASKGGRGGKAEGGAPARAKGGDGEGGHVRAQAALLISTRWSHKCACLADGEPAC